MTGTANKRAVLVAVTALLAASSGCADRGASDRAANNRAGATERTNTVATTSAMERSQVPFERPAVRLTGTWGLRLGRAQRRQAIGAAQDFAVSLTRWLYGDRKRLDVEPLTAAVRRELAGSPPYIPSEQRGTGEGRVQLLELALQTERSGIVTVTVNDLRTSYRIPAALELRSGRWQIVHLNTH